LADVKTVEVRHDYRRKESLDYNGGMVPGMIAEFWGYNFKPCTELTVDGNGKAVREIDGGKETVSTSLPLYRWTKGLVEERTLRIP
jgi:electron transfer flavoprotein beta subunit